MTRCGRSRSLKNEPMRGCIPLRGGPWLDGGLNGAIDPDCVKTPLDIQ